ncbi:MAG: hypothetical protein ACAI34_20725 [Verrucomicrobium sp.]|nr:hypothetical protein [Verrucomicrobium sp.]
MPTPEEVITHGTASLRSVVDEPEGSPTVLVEKLGRKASRTRVEIKNTRQTVKRVKEVNPIFVMSFDGEINEESGLAVAHPGTAVVTVANFSDTFREFDPTVGSLVLGETQDDIEAIEDRPVVKFDITHFPFAEAA